MFNIPSEPLSIKVPVLGYIGEFPVTGTMIMFLIEVLFFLVLFYSVSKFRVHNPSKFQIAVESVLMTLQNLIKQIAGDENVAKKILPLICSLILFILTSDILLTFLPFLTGFTYNGQSIFRTHTNDINTTLALAIMSVVTTHIFSIGKVNPINHIFKFIKLDTVFFAFRKGIKDGLMSLVDFFIGILDIISEFAKVISLSLRLFGNMFAGELLIGVLMGMFAILLPLPIMGLSLLSGVIQAIVFGSLVASHLTGVLKE